MKKLLAIIALTLLVAVIFVGCEDVEPTAVDDPDPEPTETAPDNFYIGQSIQMGDTIFTVLGVREDKGSEWMGPDDGEKWVVIEVRIDNESEESINISSLMMFSLLDQEGRKQEYGIFADMKGSLDGEIGPGRRMTGEVAFDTPEDLDFEDMELVINPTFGRGQAYVTMVEPQ